jgi:ABC-type glutathione transport system ATPase component
MKRKIRAALERALERKLGRASRNAGNESGNESDLDLDEAPSSMTSTKPPSSFYFEIRAEVEEEMETAECSGKIQEAQLKLKDYYRYAKKGLRNLSLEVRMENFTYSVPISSEAGKVKTVYNSSVLYPVYKFFQRTWRGEKKKPARIGTKKVLDDINLVLRPGKAYLLLGPPTSGKTTLLHAITGNLHPGKEDSLDGTIKYNGRTLKRQKDFHIENACAYIQQMDKHAPRLTVAETFEFAYRCRSGRPELQRRDFEDTKEGQEYAKKSEKDATRMELVASILGLSGVKDTFVGDTDIRGNKWEVQAGDEIPLLLT